MFGVWTNEGSCIAEVHLTTCGPGHQKQIRTCIDGTVDKCANADKQRIISCSDAGTPLPPCPTGDIFAAHLSLFYKSYLAVRNVLYIYF